MNLDPSQAAAVELLLSAPLGCVTGGAGTGKTTCLGAALDAMDAAGKSYLLASPTGKAARRMSEATGREASTVHRLLEWCGSNAFAMCASNPLEADLVVVDEASMLDVELAAFLFDAVQGSTRLVLIGDANQLPSVGAGRVFAEIISSGAVPVVVLDTLHRASAESWVCREAPLVLAGEMPSLEETHDFRWIECEDRGEALGEIVFRGSLGEQILAPQNVGQCGIEVINRRAQALVNPPSAGEPELNGIRVQDRVIQTRNDYTREVMNGECGVALSLDKGGMTIELDGGRSSRATADDARDLALAYALTCHRAQGSEWADVAVLVHSTHTRMLERTWLYTALTRAKRSVVIVGDRLGLERAVKADRARRRNTSLAEMLGQKGEGA